MFYRIISTALLLHLVGLCGSANAQFNPALAQWGKSDPTHLRVVTYNIEDAVCSTNFKGDSVGSWGALARVLAVLQPDILILQEAGDNNGNGTGGSLDSVSALQSTCRLLFVGGADPFLGGQVGAWVKKYTTDPAYDLPYVFVSTSNDAFNRNVILSRWPFIDLNGDTRNTYSDIPFVSSPYGSGTGGIRGFQFAEIDLPDDVYGGDLVIGNGHLKSGGGSGNENQRVAAAKNVGYFIDQFYNGGGSGVVDPTGSVSDSPPALSILNALTPVIAGGDWNQDENASLSNPSNLKGPAAWITQGQFLNGVDGSDRDRTDMLRDLAPRKIINFNGTVSDGSPLTNSAGKIDYIVYQDSIATIANQFIFDTFELNGVFPPPVATYPGNPYFVCRDAADHWPVTVDFILPPPVEPEPCAGDFNGDDAVDGADLSVLLAQFGESVPSGTGADANGDGLVNGADLSVLLGVFGTTCD